jgi:hypothetical protein
MNSSDQLKRFKIRLSILEKKRDKYLFIFNRNSNDWSNYKLSRYEHLISNLNDEIETVYTLISDYEFFNLQNKIVKKTT